MVNIAEFLKDAPKGTKLYSPLFGEVEFAEVINTEYMPIRVMKRGYGLRFDEYGRYMGNEYPDSECLLFPSKDCRTWEGWKLPVEPKSKFKVGDWITNGTFTHYIVSIVDGFYYFYGGGYLDFGKIDGYYHLWTIADAKDGDVLALNGKPFIYSHKYEKNYCYIDEWGQLRVNFSLVFEGNYVCPATKQERDLLFSKMREVGYEWDADKKELHKIKSHYDIANFHAGMPVLVRDKDYDEWTHTYYSHRTNGGNFNTGGWIWKQCIPFEGNETLLGTTDMCDEMYFNW